LSHGNSLRSAFDAGGEFIPPKDPAVEALEKANARQEQARVDADLRALGVLQDGDAA
jgi:hypothetical protein